MATDDGKATGPQLSNEMSDDQRAKLTFQLRDKYLVALDAKKRADNALKLLGKEIKADLGKGGLQDIKDMIRLSEPEGEEALREEMERRVRVMRWLAIPIGAQADLFPKDDRRPITERAFAEGKKSGLAGETFRNPYHQTNDGHKAYEKGWQEGQSVILAKMAPLDTAAAADSLAN